MGTSVALCLTVVAGISPVLRLRHCMSMVDLCKGAEVKRSLTIGCPGARDDEIVAKVLVGSVTVEEQWAHAEQQEAAAAAAKQASADVAKTSSTTPTLHAEDSAPGAESGPSKKGATTTNCSAYAGLAYGNLQLHSRSQCHEYPHCATLQ